MPDKIALLPSLLAVTKHYPIHGSSRLARATRADGGRNNRKGECVNRATAKRKMNACDRFEADFPLFKSSSEPLPGLLGVGISYCDIR